MAKRKACDLWRRLLRHAEEMRRAAVSMGMDTAPNDSLTAQYTERLRLCEESYAKFEREMNAAADAQEVTRQ